MRRRCFAFQNVTDVTPFLRSFGERGAGYDRVQMPDSRSIALPEMLDGTVNAALVSKLSEPIGIAVVPKPGTWTVLLLGPTTVCV